MEDKVISVNKDMKKKYDLIAKISGVVIGLVLVLGISYAVFRTTTIGDKDNVVNAGKLDVRVENEKDEITMDNALPQTEEQGKSNTPYTFDIVNEGTIDAMYDLYIELSDDTTLKDNDIRYYLTKTVEGTETPIDEETSHYLSDALDLEKKEKKLYRIDINDSLKVDESVSYKLYLWIDYEATKEDAANKTFSANIRVDASQLVERNETLLRKVDVSENSDGSAYAYVYDDGTLKIKGTGNIASGIDDMDIYATNPTKVLNNYKKVLTSMGYDVSGITTMDEFNTFKEEQSASDSNFASNFETQKYITIYKEVLEEMGYENTEEIVDYDTAMTYFQNNGLMDSEGNLTEEGETVQTKAEEIYNTTYADTVSIKDVIIEEGITNIPEGIYTGNSDITSVTIPSTVTSIDDYAFYNCSNLTTVKTTLMDDNKNNITYIGSDAFYGCSSLTSVDFMENSKITKIDGYTFYNCTSLTSLTIPNTITSINGLAFLNCTGITKLTIDGTKKYSDLYISNITALTITGTGDMYNYDNFKTPWNSSRSKIKDVTISDTITSIGSFAFRDCTKLTSITIPSSATSIGEYAFNNCASLTSIEIPSSITSIGSSAFLYCSALTKTSYTGTIDEWLDFDFEDCGANPTYYSKNLYINDELVENIIIDKDVKQYVLSNLQCLKSVTLTDNVTNIGTYAFFGCTGLTSITIPSSITSIGSNAFNGCSGITEITIPSTVTSIGSNAFYGSGVTKLTIDGTKDYGNLSMSNITDLVITGTGDMYNYSSNYVPWSSSRKTLKNVTISDTITSIAQYSFNGCSLLTTITIPTGVTSIGNNAFYGCTSLPSIEMPDSVLTIGSDAFNNCKALTTITIPNSVTYVGDKAFRYWTSSQTINIDNTEEYVNANYATGSWTWKTGCNATINYLRT